MSGGYWNHWWASYWSDAGVGFIVLKMQFGLLFYLEVLLSRSGNSRLTLAYLQAAPSQRVKLILSAFNPNSTEVPARVRNLLLSEAIIDWVEHGNKKMGEIIVGRIIPQQTEHKRTNDVGDNTLDLVKSMSGEKRQKLLEEALGARVSPVKADYEVTK